MAANGDVANKIGTCLKAIAATEFSGPFYVATPWSTFDASCHGGGSIPIEERSPDEVLVVNGLPIGPAGAPARNWGFDVTLARHVTGYITPSGVLTAADLGSAAAVAMTRGR